MTLLLILGGAMVILAVVLVSVAVGTTASGEAVSGVDRSVALVQALTNAPKELTKEYDASFGDRIMAPFQARALEIARRLSGSDAAERIRRRLDVAGNPAGWTVERVQAGKVIGAIVLFLVVDRLHRRDRLQLRGAGRDRDRRDRRRLAGPEPVPLPEGLRPLRADAARRCPTPST